MSLLYRCTCGGVFSVCMSCIDTHVTVFMWSGVCVSVCVDAHAAVCMWSSKKNFSESLLTFQHMDLEDQTQVIGLGGEPLPTEWFLPPKTDF